MTVTDGFDVPVLVSRNENGVSVNETPNFFDSQACASTEG
jgi:hypothetical protein